MATKHGDSYIDDVDLASLDLSPVSPPHSLMDDDEEGSHSISHSHSHRVHNGDGGAAYYSSPNSSSYGGDDLVCGTSKDLVEITHFSPKRVAFCPLALLIECATDCKVAKAATGSGSGPAGAGDQQANPKRRPRLAVRTFSVDKPKLSTATKATSRAWQAVCANFSTGLQPLLSPSAGSSDGSRTITYSAPLRPPSPDQDREKTSFRRSRSNSGSSYDSASSSFSSSKFIDDDDELDCDNLLQDDPHFIPNPPSRLTIKLPSLTRRVPTALPSPSSIRGILKPSSPLSSSPPPLTHATSISPASGLPITAPPPSISSSGGSRSRSRSVPSFSPPSTAPHAHRRLMASHLVPEQHGQVVPLSDCCQRCEDATEKGLDADDNYVEPWSKAARRKKKFDAKRAAGMTSSGMVGPASPVAEAVELQHELRKEGGEDVEEEEVQVPAESLIATAVVDELQRATKKGVAPKEVEEDEGGRGDGESESSSDVDQIVVEDRADALGLHLGASVDGSGAEKATSAPATVLGFSPPLVSPLTTEVNASTSTSDEENRPALSSADILPPQRPTFGRSNSLQLTLGSPTAARADSTPETEPSPVRPGGKRRISAARLMSIGKGIVDGGFAASLNSGRGFA